VPIPKIVIPKDPDAVTALKNLREKVQTEIQKYRRGNADIRPQRLPHINDFSRLARRICGTSIGVVLGGGGARGIAHLVGFYITAICPADLTIRFLGINPRLGGMWYPNRPYCW